MSTEVEQAELIFDRFESIWRERFGDSGPVIQVAEGEQIAERFEVGQFGYGLMASIMRTGRALVMLSQSGYAVEASPMFRSLLDQAMALEALLVHGVHAVHAFGLEHRFNFQQLLRAAEEGFPLGQGDREYISKFLAMADALPKSKELGQAQHGIKTSTIGREYGQSEKYLYQMWLYATPLSKPSMKLADMYSQAEREAGGIRMLTFLDSDPDATVDPRLVLQMIVPSALLAFALSLRDTAFAEQVRTEAMGFDLPIDPRLDRSE
ncbi:DUF5677 domain-containing protein [Microbacterium sp. 179-I 3D3 NHS]|uniref:DUF5677 domain-containing protein n=1 Tax=Microbacterium sp. 179-I 3D3 NHS TaxID=3142382 RepID=UPI0039A10CB7